MSNDSITLGEFIKMIKEQATYYTEMSNKLYAIKDAGFNLNHELILLNEYPKIPPDLKKLINAVINNLTELLK